MRILLVGDTQGVQQLLRHVPREHVAALCAASIRPQYLSGMKEIARGADVPLLIQPKTGDAAYESFRADLAGLDMDLIVVNSYSMLIPADVLRLSRLGGLNIHHSLLPLNRGPNPIQWAMLRGENATGVTMHEMTLRFDEGPIVDQRRIPLLFEDTWLTVKARLDAATEELLRQSQEVFVSGQWKSRPQDNSLATRNVRRSVSDSYFSWGDRLIDIYRLHRAVLPPLPPAWTLDEGGHRIELKEAFTPMQLLHLLWAERQTLVAHQQSPNAEDLCTGWGRVHLRPIRREDSSLIFGWITNHELAMLNGTTWRVSEVDHEQWIESILVRGSDAIVFVIENGRGEPVGVCQLANINWMHRSAELQVRIVPGAQDLGLDAISIEQLSRFGFTELRLHRVSLAVLSSNLLSIRAFESAGFLREGHLRQAAIVDGESRDVIVMGLFCP